MTVFRCNLLASPQPFQFPRVGLHSYKSTPAVSDKEIDFFTNHTGLTYTLISVVEPSRASNDTLPPSLSYLNNPIENCEISLIEIQLEAADRTAWQYGTQQWGSTTRVGISHLYLQPVLIETN